MKSNYRKIITRTLKVNDIKLNKIKIKENNYPLFQYVIEIKIKDYDDLLMIILTANDRKEFRTNNYEKNLKNQLIDEIEQYKKRTNEEESD